MMTNGDLVKEGQIDPSCTSSDILISNDQKERLGLKNRKFFFINFLTFLYLKKANYQLVCYISRNNLMISHENQGGQFDPPPLVPDRVEIDLSIQTWLLYKSKINRIIFCFRVLLIKRNRWSRTDENTDS